MNFNSETQEKIKQFAKEQSQHYLDAAEMTYMEKLRSKTGQTKQKIGKTLARFKGSSVQAIEAQNDMFLYMSDYMNDLMSRGMSELEAFDKAKEELAASEESGLHSDLHQRINQYYENRDPAEYEAVGLFYGGFLFIGLSIGALAGYVLGGGRQDFLNDGWIDALVGMVTGGVLGIGIAEICHALIGLLRRKQ